jgi:hypothetical protein
MTPEEQYAHFYRLCCQVMDSILRDAWEAGRKEEREACARIGRDVAEIAKADERLTDDVAKAVITTALHIVLTIEARSQETTP